VQKTLAPPKLLMGDVQSRSHDGLHEWDVLKDQDFHKLFQARDAAHKSWIFLHHYSDGELTRVLFDNACSLRIA
jgi:hypothetical protein